MKLNPDDLSATLTFNNGKIQKEEFYYGSSFLSQSSRFLSIGKNVTTAEILDIKGNKRKMSFGK